MARGRMTFLSKDEIERMHVTALRILAEVGVTVHSEETVGLMREGGATLSEDGRRVLIPESLVKSAISSAPKSVLLAARDKKWDARIPAEDGRLYVCNGGEGVFVKNLVTGESRYSTTDDVRDFAIFCNEIPQIDICWLMVGALDQPAHLKYLVELKTTYEYSMKHVQTMSSSGPEAKRLVRIASILAGSEKELEKRCILSAVQCPLSPLTFEKGLVEGQVELSRANVPIIAMVAAVSGMTAPVTLSGTMAQVTAENLASLVISQLARKGSPWIFSSDSVPGDLKTGSIDYGSFEANLLRTAASEMARYYDLPVMCAGVGLENTSIGLGSIQEGVPYMVVQSLVDSDLGSGFGGVDQAVSASFEQMLVDAWVWDVAREFRRNFDSDAAAISYDTIREASLDGNFLSKRHTVTRFRKESAVTTHIDAILTGRGNHSKAGALIRKAREEAERLLARPKVQVVSRDEALRMNEVVDEAK